MLAIDIQKLCKNFAGTQALTDVSFSVPQGRVHGFLGPNGAGKSTTMKIICGLLKASSGSVKVLGEDVEKNLPFVKTQVGVLPEHPPLYMDMVVRDYLTFVAGIHNVPRRLRSGYVGESMEKTGLDKVGHRLIGNLSKGMQQRVALAQALVFKPRILILDEPTLGLDPASIIEIRQLIHSLQGEHTLLLSTHHLHEVAQCCQDVTIIHQGQVVVSDSMERVQQQFSTQQVITAEVMPAQSIQLADLESGLQSFPFVDRVQVEDLGAEVKKIILHINEKKDQRAFIGQFLMEKGHQLLSLSRQSPQLEDIFLQLTQVPGEGRALSTST